MQLVVPDTKNALSYKGIELDLIGFAADTRMILTTRFNPVFLTLQSKQSEAAQLILLWGNNWKHFMRFITSSFRLVYMILKIW
jgi:hypothetical protein